LKLTQRRAVGSTVLSIAYDLPQLSSINEPVIQHINGFIRALDTAINLKALIIDFFPWMRYMPSPVATWRKDAEGIYTKYSNMFEGMFRDVEARIVL
jgi:hypothetical protein